MDTSKKYISMCEKATEIQRIWEYDDADFMVAPVRENEDFQERDKGQDYVIWVVCDYYSAACYNGKEKRQDHPQAHESYFDEYSDTFRNFDGGYEWENKLIAKRKNCIWLPRQDQLQEMVKAHYQKHLKILYDFSMTVSWSVNSFEKLWLAFVMKEKYKKTWDGEKWIGGG